MPLYDYECRSCRTRIRDQWFQTWREAPKALACPCGRDAIRLIGLPVLDSAEIRNRVHIPGKYFWEGTPWSDSDMTNPYIKEGDPGHFKENTNHREYVDLGKGVRNQSPAGT